MSEKKGKSGSKPRGHGPASHAGHEEAHEGAPEWLISFADNVTLMMGFFVILLALTMTKLANAVPDKAGGGDGEASGPSPAMLDWTLGVREAFNNPVSIHSTNPNELPLILRMLERSQRGRTTDDGVPGERPTVQSIRPSNYYSLCGSAPFDEGSSELNADAQKVVKDVAQRLRGLRLIVEVRGHVSALEAFREKDRGMRLSFDRALSVARGLVAHDLDWRQLRLLACGDNDRINPLTYQQHGHRKNERVEISVTDAIVPDYETPPPKGEGGDESN